MASRLNNPDFMKFPLEMGANGAATSKRREHVREQIAQVLFELGYFVFFEVSLEI